MDYHRFVSEGKGKQKSRNLQEISGKSDENHRKK